ncbi:MAG TPA: hypothetical protein VHV78_02215 [Gemmatimonadaceae bacterium]|jgi:hypothetical protein|nr:hypothetical protein [Gemmatimonadaceae bacterium]
MPIVDFNSLPDASRVWVFASDRPLSGDGADALLAAVDDFLSTWAAHGVPLRCARDWRDGRFLAVGVDVTGENASGCSIDGLFRRFQQLERTLGAKLVGGGRVFYRTRAGIEMAPQSEFANLIKLGGVARETPVFDTSITAASDWRTSFERPAGQAWTAPFFADRSLA